MTLVMGVDSSTQSCKVVIADAATGRIVRSGRAPHPDGTSVDPEAWWHALQQAIADAGGMDDVEAWSVGGQQHGMVALDAGGAVIRDALLWNDTRSGGAASDLIAEFGADALAERTGLVPVASFTITKLRWLRDAEPDNAARVAAVALPHDWLTWRLRGFGPDRPDLGELVTDRSDASGTGYWSPATGEYDRELLAAALGHDAVLPRVLGATEYVTDADGRRVGPGAGDNAGAALGVGAATGDVVVSIGTSGTAFAVSETRTIDPTGTVAGFADAAGGFLPLVATLNAARVLDATARLLGVDHAGLTDLAAAAEPGSGGVVLVPWFEGERTPNLPTARASLEGLSLQNTTRENLARAAVEGMLAGLATGVDAIRGLGVEARRVLLVGGAAQNAAVAAVAAQVFDVPVAVPAPGEYVALGAARQAAGVLAGALPDWPVEMHRAAASDPHPDIRTAYDAVAQRRAADLR
ncbi:xylulokinase [Microbacterium sp. EYE_5]|uniref:xylulokinase n=1 Tax=unclassified Microbacterium TaxID=2609290 RepID=UPI002003A021|nr:MULTISPECIES: xylulokinase [unclassified Microbacterium]MCK6079899.1 xylulokinase [Microbacterium sp. EYE_382]MCK6085170.1 xylulokinase [Microbacterium sp. EYE_384]MCK6122604.1 xylulokinase [Microbacterium sp. EYE_80]MCK6125933.1 xylulokinase [Microbacterium sp. EYE_79]MCK6140854.1 xylulokinase [Microbacterium sp. EYE_39]